MNATLKYLFDDNIPITSSPSLFGDFFYEDHFTRLYQEGLTRIRSKQEEQQYVSLLKALEELNDSESPLKTHQPSDPKAFYEKNLQWIDQKQKKIRENREALLRKEEEQQIKSKNQRNILSQNNAFYLPFDYIGPIKGWDRHFHDFFLKKTTKIDSKTSNFKPLINENSKKLAYYNSANNSEKVEDRLLRKGKDLETKKEISRKQYELLKDFPCEKAKYKRTEEEIKKAAEKLYNDAKISKENKDLLIKSHEEQFPFKPNINKAGTIDANKRKPLYYIKNSPKESKKQKKKPFDPEIWDSFLKRNQNTLENKKNSIENSKKTLITKEIEECSFKPGINPHTLRILTQAHKLEKGLLERQNEFSERHKENFDTLLQKDLKVFKETCTFKPKISKSVEKLKEIHERKDRNKSFEVRKNKEKDGYSGKKAKKHQQFLSKEEKNNTPNFNRIKEVSSLPEINESKIKAIKDFEWIDEEIKSLLN